MSFIPPVQNMDDFKPGDFSFIKTSIEREALTHDYQVIENIGVDAWKALSNHNPSQSFLWDTKGDIWDTICKQMWYGHSGASMALSLRSMEYIAKHGWEDYVFLMRP